MRSQVIDPDAGVDGLQLFSLVSASCCAVAAESTALRWKPGRLSTCNTPPSQKSKDGAATRGFMWQPGM
jgi:hypothetical protein